MENFIEFINQNLLLSLMFVGVIVAIVFYEFHLKLRGFKTIPPAVLTSLINQSDAVVIDVRNANEFHTSHIINAKNIPNDQLIASIAEKLAKYKEKPIVLYCKTGQISTQSCYKAIKAGFKNVYALQGGFSTWQAEHMPVAKKRK